jgi:hypothetical protein
MQRIRLLPKFNFLVFCLILESEVDAAQQQFAVAVRLWEATAETIEIECRLSGKISPGGGSVAGCKDEFLNSQASLTPASRLAGSL